MSVKLIVKKPSIKGSDRFLLVDSPEGDISQLGALPQCLAMERIDDDWASLRLKHIQES